MYRLALGCSLASILLWSVVSGAVQPTPEPSVGFIWHYPFVDAGTSEIPKSGATMMDSRAVWLAIEQERGKMDFSTIDRQIDFAKKNGLQLALILEMNPFAKPHWVMDEATKAGETTKDFFGGNGEWPRYDSKIMHDTQEEFLKRLAEHLKTADKSHVITHYHPGIEWWYPYTTRYAESNIATFRRWLARKYGSIARLNEAWGSSFGSFDVVAAPMLDVNPELYARGRAGMARMAFVGRDISPETRPYKNARVVSDDWYWFWCETSADYINELAAMTKRHDPTRQTVSFLTFSFALPAEWDYVQWGAVRLDEVAMRAKSLDVLGLQLSLAEGDPYRIAAALDVARKYGKPMWDLDLLDFAAGVGIGKEAMERGTHVAIQHGASGLVYCCWNGAKDFNFYPDWRLEDLNEMLTGARKSIKLMSGMKVRPEGAIVMPILPVSPDDPAGMKNDVGSFMGWYKLVERCGATVDVVTLREMEKGADLSHYGWVLVPDCAFLPKRAADALAAYARDGGKVISGGRFGNCDEVGHPLPTGALPRVSVVPDYGKVYTGRFIRNGHAGDTPPMIMDQGDSAARSRSIASARTALGRLGVGANLEILADGRDLRCVEYARGKDRAFYLVNMQAGTAAHAQLRVHLSSKVRVQVFADTQETPCASRQNGGWLEIPLPEFQTSCIVKLLKD